MQLTAHLTRRAIVLAAALALCVAALVAPMAAPADRLPSIFDPGLLGTAGGSVPVIVQSDGDAGSAARFIRGLGGTVTRDLPIVHGFSARVPADTLDEIARHAAVRAITLDRSVHLMSGGPRSTRRSPNTATIRANDVWSSGVTGSGVTVALIDTGVASIPDLNGRIVGVTDDNGLPASCVNFSGEQGCGDSYGHGTFVAGIIAGKGAAGGKWKGVAPGSRILSIKIAGRDGAADVSTVLAALQWIVSHKDEYGIGVVNLSLGTDSPQPYAIDPLNYAVERAWWAGIVVVVAAGNRGPDAMTVTKPADDPWVVTVGAIDDSGTAALDDDVLPNFTGRGPTLSDAYAKPDVVAPGAHVVSLRAPGSAVDEAFPYYIDNNYRRASGTSFAAPAVAGTVALMLERNPSMTPDQVKYALLSSARGTTSSDPFAVGSGVVDAYTATMSPPAGAANQGLLQSNGLGSLQASRGTLIVTTSDTVPVLIEGTLTAQLRTFDSIMFTTTGWTGGQWHGGQWHGGQWHGGQWHGGQWHGGQWHGGQWHEVPQDGDEQDYGTPYLGSLIYGAWE